MAQEKTQKCQSCSNDVPLAQEPPYVGHTPTCALVRTWNGDKTEQKPPAK